MCGLAGVFSAAKIRNSREAVEGLLAPMAHRGPDAWGVYLADQIAMGHLRLSIVDVEGGHQPMTSERYVLSYNGEIFNYLELKQELELLGLKFKTKSDTEVALKSFEVYGVHQALEKFNGQFALLLWDKLEKRLFAARDRMGIRPLYILQHDQVCYFASEVKAFDSIPDYQRTFNTAHLFEHALLWNTIGDTTVFEDIRTVPAGCYEVYGEGKYLKRSRYYEIGESAEPQNSPPFDQAVQEFTELLEDAVMLRLRSDVPVAAYLSGGIDSSVISYLTSRIKGERFKTFSVAFADSDYDESSYQKEMVDRLESCHTEVKVDYEMIDRNMFDAVYHCERPLFRTAPVPLYLLSDEVNRQGIKVVLTGEGADEILFGYDSYKEIKLLDFWQKNPGSKLRPQLIKRLYPHLQHYKDPRQFGLMRMYYEGFLNNYSNDLVSLNIRIHNNKIISNFFNKDFNISFDYERLIDKVRQTLPANFSTWTLLQKNQFLEMKSLLSGYLLSSQGDRMSMAHGVEGRYPFLDHRLVEKMFHYPDKYKLNVLQQKHILTQAFQKYIPRSILHRPKRPYTAPDLKSFFRDDRLTEGAAYFLSDSVIDEFGIFDKKYVARFLGKFTRGVPDTIGYRDNMLITYILSAQMLCYSMKNPRRVQLDASLRTVNITQAENDPRRST